MKLSDPISSLTGVGAKLSEAFALKGIITLGDLLFYLPRRHDDYSHILPIAKLRPGPVSLRGRINNLKTRRIRRNLSITEAIASDDSDSVKLVWFNQPYRQSGIKTDQTYYISGQYKLSNRHYSIINPNIELVSDLPLQSARILPVYPESKTLKSAQIRRLMTNVLPLSSEIKEFMPDYVNNELKLMTYAQAIATMHYPSNLEDLAKAKLRLNFNELFPLMLANELSTRDMNRNTAISVKFKLDLAKTFVNKLPFNLTDDQRRVIWQIYQDMQSTKPMNRLVEGDVGSGKTVVAVMAAVMAMDEGYSVAFMAPTELLAKQHADTINKLLTPLGLADKLVLLTGSLKKSAKTLAIDKANATAGSLVIGTHSLLTSGVDWKNLALLIIDEQHRFGVDQRMEIQKQAKHLPHFLSITATPIPRSLALTVLSDLKLSQLKTKPADRLDILTDIIAPSGFNRYLDQLKTELSAGHQAYVVCPYIKATDTSDGVDVETIATTYAKKLPKYPIGVLHGQMSAEAQTEVMKKFLNGEIKVLVATTVIEVGVDVPNATIMTIYGPEHFGLAQLHQLRGRVGRSQYQSHCFLIQADNSEPLPRLREFARLSDGFALSELDLRLRGPGAIYGKLQHGKFGFSLTTLDDAELVGLVKQAVDLFFKTRINLVNYKYLAQLVQSAQHITYLN